MNLNVLVTGANGQLAACIKDIEWLFPNISFIYTNLSEINLTDKNTIDLFFKNNNINWCVNCAAYTAVDDAESDEVTAYKVNAEGVKNLAINCKKYNVKLIHISTDFVFDGLKSSPYNEEDKTNPIGIYGASKLQGEKALIETLKEFYIIRTAWLYSEHGNNFMKTMLRLAKNKKELNIVADQIGTPTYAKDLANCLLQIIVSNNKEYGIYHFSNEGVASWYDFTKAIFDITKSEVKVNPIPSTDFPTQAERPSYSVLDKDKIKKILNIEVPYWRESLKQAIINYNE